MSFSCNCGSRAVILSLISTTDGRSRRPQSLLKLHASAISSVNIKKCHRQFNVLINIVVVVFIFIYLHQIISYARSYEFQLVLWFMFRQLQLTYYKLWLVM